MLLSACLKIIDTSEDKSRFEELYYLYRQKMYSVAYGILKNSQNAEDAVQDAFFRIAENFSKISEINCPRTHAFVVIIVRNICFNMLRRGKRFIDMADEELEMADSGISVEDEALSSRGVEELCKALDKLPHNYHDILYLTAFEGYSIKEASVLLGITYDNAKIRLRRARERLAEIFEETGYERP